MRRAAAPRAPRALGRGSFSVRAGELASQRIGTLHQAGSKWGRGRERGGHLELEQELEELVVLEGRHEPGCRWWAMRNGAPKVEEEEREEEKTAQQEDASALLPTMTAFHRTWFWWPFWLFRPCKAVLTPDNNNDFNPDELPRLALHDY